MNATATADVNMRVYAESTIVYPARVLCPAKVVAVAVALGQILKPVLY